MVSSIWPVLHFDDTQTARRFLVEVLGLTADVVVTDDVGDVIHAELSWRGAGVLQFGGTKHTGGVHGQMRSGAAATYLVTDLREQVDAMAERVRDADVGAVRSAPTWTTFGNAAAAYACTVADHEGNLWTFGTYAGDR